MVKETGETPNNVEQSEREAGAKDSGKYHQKYEPEDVGRFRKLAKRSPASNWVVRTLGEGRSRWFRHCTFVKIDGFRRRSRIQ